MSMTEDIGTPLSAYELDAFLQLGWTARLACLDDHGHPYIVPIWHQWGRERFWLIGSEHAIWVRYLLASPAVALSIDNPETVTRVMCQGRAKHVEGPSVDGRWVGIALDMAERYLGREALPEYQSATAGMARWLFAVEVDRMVSWRGAGRTN